MKKYTTLLYLGESDDSLKRCETRDNYLVFPLFQSSVLIFLSPLVFSSFSFLCVKEEFLKDVMQFLILRGHNRLIPQGGLAEFPDAILNAKRLDLFNLYREVRLLDAPWRIGINN